MLSAKPGISATTLKVAPFCANVTSPITGLVLSTSSMFSSKLAVLPASSAPTAVTAVAPTPYSVRSMVYTKPPPLDFVAAISVSPTKKVKPEMTPELSVQSIKVAVTICESSACTSWNVPATGAVLSTRVNGLSSLVEFSASSKAVTVISRSPMFSSVRLSLNTPSPRSSNSTS